MPNPEALPTAAPAKLTVWADPAGTPYLVQQQPDGSNTFTPLETALAQTPPPMPHTYREPLNTLLLSIAVVLGFVFGGYCLGFLAGAAGQRVIVIPRSPVCDTHRSSFLFWSSETKECQ